MRATWTIPRIVCNRPLSSIAFWVGLGGATSRSRALEQIGTSVDCSDRAVVSFRTRSAAVARAFALERGA